MQLIPTAEVKEGMCLAREVRDDRGRILLARGQRMTESVMGRLNRFRVERVYIRDGFGEESPELLRAEMKLHCEEVLRDSFKSFHEEAKKKRYALDAHAMQSLTESVIAALMSNRDPLVMLLDVSTASDRLLNHSVSATILAILLGKALRVSPDMLNHLGTAMMFHDIGFMFIPEEISGKTGTLTPSEVKTLKSHVTLGAAHLVRASMVNKIAGNIVLHHHEMMDGTGYPDCVKGESMSQLCRIAAVAEVYDSLTSPRPYAAPVMPDVAISYLLKNAGTLFAREVVTSLCHIVALYPTGTAVQLNTGETGVVLTNRPQSPFRPALRLMTDYRGKTLTPTPVYDLARDGMRYIVRSALTLSELATPNARTIKDQAIDSVHLLC